MCVCVLAEKGRAFRPVASYPDLPSAAAAAAASDELDSGNVSSPLLFIIPLVECPLRCAAT